MTFEEVKARLVAEPVLACPDISRTFLLQTDPSEKGKRVISYSIRTLNGAKKNYLTMEKECLAIVWAIRKLWSYLEGYQEGASGRQVNASTGQDKEHQRLVEAERGDTEPSPATHPLY